MKFKQCALLIVYMHGMSYLDHIIVITQDKNPGYAPGLFFSQKLVIIDLIKYYYDAFICIRLYVLLYISFQFSFWFTI